MEKLKFDKSALRKFGNVMGIAFFVITLLLFLKHKHINLITAAVFLVFFLLGFIRPLMLKPIYLLWMKLSFILGWINTRLILTIVFYLIFTPIGLILRLFGKDLLDVKIDRNSGSYWKKKEPKTTDLLNYKRQF